MVKKLLTNTTNSKTYISSSYVIFLLNYQSMFLFNHCLQDWMKKDAVMMMFPIESVSFKLQYSANEYRIRLFLII